MTTIGKGWRTVAAALIIGVFGVVHSLSPEVKLPDGQTVQGALDAFELILSLVTPVVMVLFRIFSNTKIGTKDVPQTPPPNPRDVIRSPVLMAVFALVLAMVAMLSVPSAYAQTAPLVVNFGSSVTAANGSLKTTLTWSTVPAVGVTCVATGTPTTWAGAKPSAGTFDLPVITQSGSYSPTLTCTLAVDNTMQFDWAAPVANTDGTTLTDLSGFNLYWGTGVDPSTLLTKQVLAAGARTWTTSVLAPGTYSGYLTAITTHGAESDGSRPIVSKTIKVAATPVSESIPLTVGAKPNPPTNVTVK
jgi:hypothetical protein